MPNQRDVIMESIAGVLLYEVTDEELEAAAENALGGRCSCRPCKSLCSQDSRIYS